MSCPLHLRTPVPCHLHGLVNAYPENPVKACLPSEIFPKAQSILGNWRGRGFPSSFHPKWSLCLDSFWWLSPLWLPPSWLACGRDTCLCPILLYTYATRHLKFGRADRTAAQDRNHRLRGSQHLGKERINWALEHFPPRGFLGSPDGVPQPASAHLGKVHFLFSPPSDSYPSQPGCARKHFSIVPLGKADGTSLSVILSHLNRSR